MALTTVQAARIAGADPIVAVEVRPEKLELAERAGATAVVSAAEKDALAAVRRASDGGADYVFEALGTEETVQQAWVAAAPGSCVVVGLMPKGSLLTIDPSPLRLRADTQGVLSRLCPAERGRAAPGRAPPERGAPARRVRQSAPRAQELDDALARLRRRGASGRPLSLARSRLSA
jgi:NADPH:quinone reductase-like Zn-dependent oxidoreductase